MKNYMMVNDKKIEISQETVNNLEQEFGEKVTFSIGDRFMTLGNKSILVYIGDSRVCMITLKSGLLHFSSEKVGDIRQITEAEMKKICGCPLYRYWDSRKKVKCDT